MNAPTEFQIIVGDDGKPAFVVIPYALFCELKGGVSRSAVPHEVVTAAYERRITPMAAWREYLGLTQAELATRIGVAQPAYAQMERGKRPRKATLEKVAAAMGLEVDQLRW